MSTDGAPQLPDVNPDGGYVSLDPATSQAHSNQSNGGYTLHDVKDSAISSAQAAMESVQNHPITQNAINGPVAQNARAEAQKTSSEFRDLAGARKTPDQPAATGQPLTHYHSMFYRLLSWKNPRATAISFACSVLLIFAGRYMNIVRYVFKALYLVLGTTALAEIAGKAALGNGLASQMRPRKYVMIRKESLERFTDDLEQLINFFVIEFQRIVFAENIYVTVAAFFATFISYWLIKIIPLWGLALIGTIMVYSGPLIYMQNKEAIDAQLRNTNHMLNQQANQFKDLAAQHSARAQETMRTYANEYSNKAQEMIGQAKNKAAGATSKAKGQAAATTEMAQEKASAATSQAQETDQTAEPTSRVQEGDFPSAPSDELPIHGSAAGYPVTAEAQIPEPAI
ncbi:uncharacterized protein K452DRAFT_351523 [Aplosporella prunicola CBS 121167]|uniref:Reticulon-like protein n=1 Tax=Aplosporella prunicola CBS 121167 TaxID=1176127 RepID=A0A6A6BCS7_9PEZI|nr:uncharacterized protein K452DRAFT_351523 [Aplosporella prunicola CBS 121167]KAF2141408.1 hypothetical protein K452DRAFT_351523 [Aplosporella prunicola CBS 121167]